MDMNTLRGIATIVVMTAFLGICFWAYSSSRKAQFDDTANSIFAEDIDETDDTDETDANK
jgi:cytochrome c oxidase cbb3-type subunit 4